MDSRISSRALAAALGGWRAREPAYEALADGIRLLCLDNRLAPRTTLPAERDLSAALGVSRATVASAYRSLRDSAHIASHRGSGSVTLPLPRRTPARSDTHDGLIDLQQASPAAWPGLAAAFAEAAADIPSLAARPGYDLIGMDALRAAVAEAYTARGVPTTVEQVMITAGAQSAIHLIASVVVGRGDRVVMETPTYPHAADAFRQAGARLVGVPVTTDAGWDMDRLIQTFERTAPVAAYLMPDFQNPTGRSMTSSDRAVTFEAAQRAGTLLILDETTADLDIDRGPLDPGFVEEDADLVVRVGSLGKTVWGGLRVGWIRAAAPVLRRLVAARPARDLGTPEFEQAVAARVLSHYPEVTAQRAELLRLGRDTVTAQISGRLPQWRVPPVHGGVSLWVALDAPLSAALVMQARAEGLLLSAGPRFSLDGGHERHLRVPFTADATTLARAVDVLAGAWERVVAGVPTTGHAALDAVV
ncbi:PLP-dependent aminotransferase family protein [Microbacterium sp. NPDC077184]|uniref:MocR-like transcription factor YczR n=1 Tax=Microbacterium sp. NPDC077184 TaxID=3154764 RepID=UPI00343AB21D